VDKLADLSNELSEQHEENLASSSHKHAAASAAHKPSLKKLEEILDKMKQYGGAAQEVAALEKKIKALKKSRKLARKAKKKQNQRDQHQEAEQAVARQKEQLAYYRAFANVGVAPARDEQGAPIDMQVVEVRADAGEIDPVEFITTDPCCDASADAVDALAEGHSADGTYTIFVEHSGLSLSHSGRPDECGSYASLPHVYVEYECPQQCSPNPRFLDDWERIFASSEDITDDVVDDCSVDSCNGNCFQPNDQVFQWSKGHIVPVEAKRLRDCVVKGGYRSVHGGERLNVMTSSCRERFEVFRQLLFDKLSD
jgi:hypothetical protein